MHTVSCVASEGGTPALYVNGERLEGLAYITYLTKKNRYADFASAGYRLFSLPVFFGFNRLNENSGLDVFTKGIFDGDTPDFSVFDADIARILAARPDAYICPRVNVSPSRAWEEAHPSELCESYPDGRLGRVSFASDVWAATVKEQLAIFIEHIEKSDYAAHIVGYQIAGGNTEEWLPLDSKKGISGPRAMEKYEAYLASCGEERGEASFYRFYSSLVASRIIEFAGEVKRVTDRRLAVGVFYGYTLETPSRTSGHHALHALLTSADVDFICSPISYAQTRKAGREHPYMVPFSSIQHHGKLYFSENDTRTHLSRAVNESEWYNKPIWFGPDKMSSMEIIKMHAARALLHGHAAWWFDMWGGWYADDDYMTLLGRIREIFEEAKALPAASVSEVAVFVDEEAYASLEDTSVSNPVCYAFRESLGKMGAPYDLYLASDAEDVLGKYKAAILLQPTRSEKGDRVISLARAQEKALLLIDAENASVTSEDLRAFLRAAGVHLTCERDSVIYENESYLFLHTVESGEHSLKTRGEEGFFDVFTGEPFDGKAALSKEKSYLLRRFAHS